MLIVTCSVIKRRIDSDNIKQLLNYIHYFKLGVCVHRCFTASQNSISFNISYLFVLFNRIVVYYFHYY